VSKRKTEIYGGMIVQYSDICTRRRTRHEWESDSKVRLGKSHHRGDHEGREGELRYISGLSLTSALDGGGWSRLLYPRGKDLVSMAQEAGWDPGPGRTDAQTLFARNLCTLLLPNILHYNGLISV
jgi:hypothetical protein